ncbi:MAG TPA: ATP-binding cassette domain-containing protein [Polyangiaceae bacterium]|jgi:osmoprotectant transport system ATP-binding protein|nr:ATP-binding cassette domain-containing protein [Polyangiaceae bacterium]
MIELERVSKRYGGHAVVNDVSFDVKRGETLVLLGRSGSGKTTTLKMINRLIEPSSGEIRVFGRPIDEPPKEELRRSIGYVIQAVGLFPHYTVEENVAVVPELLGWERPRIEARVAELLELIGLPKARFGGKRPSELSGGQQQRVGLARALASDPPVVLLDEPFGALDPVTRREMQAEFVRLSAKLGKTMVLVTHDVAEAITVGHRICLLEGGRLEQLGRAQELLFEPKTDFVRAFFDPGRLALELLATSLKDVVPHLSSSPRVGAPSIRVPSVMRLLDVLERRDAVKDTVFEVTDDGEAVAAVTAVALLEAFYAFRSARETR